MPNERTPVVFINAKIYDWQKEELRRHQRRLGVLSLSEALRSVLSEAFPHLLVSPLPSEPPEVQDEAESLVR